MTNNITYNGKEYPTRWIHVSDADNDFDEDCHIGTVSLFDALTRTEEQRLQELTEWEKVRNDPEYNNARNIDDLFFGYVPDEIINADDRELEEYIIKNLL